MARRDVELVIRAKDEAAKVVDQITKALNEFYDGTKKLDQGAEKSENALVSLGAAIGKLDKALDSAAGTDKLATNLDKAAASLSRLEAKMESTQTEANDQARALNRAASETERYTAKMEGATQALDRQKASVAKAKTDQKELAAAQTAAASAVGKLTAKQAKLPAQIEKQAASVQKAAARYEELSVTMAGTVSPSATLRTQFEASERSVAQKTARLRELQSELSEVTSDLRGAQSAVALFGGQSAKAATSLAKQERALSKIEQNYIGLKTQVGASAGVQSQLQKDVDRTSASLTKQAGEIERAESSYVELAAAAGQADAAISKFADSSLAELSGQLTAQKKATLEAKQEWKLAETNVKELGAAIAATKSPSAELVQSFERTRSRARLAKTEYTANKVALEQMGRAYQEAGRDINSISASASRFESSARNLSTELQRIDGRAVAVANAMSRADAATKTHTGTVGRLAAAYRQFYGDSRTSLGLMQRIRGEVLSLVAAYGGLYAGIEVIRAAVTATETLAGVSSRLNVAFGGDEGKAAAELDYIRRQADRLGVSFTDLATEYSKFAVATKGTNLAGEATRKIFIGVAEAARVNRASQSELQGVFTALTQIVSKGAVQMEELRQQLGDRLPGAIQIMADALGVSTAELIKMMEQGQVTADALIPFADKLAERFGTGLEEAVTSTSASLGRLKNAAFQALLVFNNGGFGKGFQNFADTLTEVLTGADFESFARRAGAAFGTLFDILAVGAENFDLIVAAAAGFVGLRLTPVVYALVTGFLDLGRSVTAGVVAMRAGTTAATATTGAMVGLRGAMTALLSSTGIGLLVAAISAGIALWATNADNATEALNSHRTIVDQVKTAYDEVGGSVARWKENLDGLTASEARANLQRIEEVVSGLQGRLELLASGNNDFWTNFFGYNLSAKQEIFSVSDRYLSEIQGVVDQFQSGQIGADALIPALDGVNEKFRDGSEEATQFAEANIQAARDLLEAMGAATEAKDVVEALTDENGKAQEAFDELGDAASDAGEDLDDSKKNAEDFNAAMEKMGELIPAVKKEMEFQAAVAELEAVFAAALKAANGIDEMAAAAKRFEAAKSALETGNFSASNFEAQYVARAAAGAGSQEEELVRAVTALSKEMGLAAEDLLTVISYETGGKLSPGTLGPTTQWGQHFGLIQFGQPQGAKYGVSPQSSTTEQVIAAGRYLEDAGVKAGDGLLRIYAAINAGDPNKIHASDENNGGAPGSVLDKVNDQMAGHNARAKGLLAAYGGVVQETETLIKENDKLAETQRRQGEATDKRLADTAFELEQQKLKTAGLSEQAAVEAAIRQAKAENPAITQAELDLIAAQVAQTHQLAAAKKAAKTETNEGKEAEKAVNQLLTQRNELEKQREIALENGDTETANQLATEIEAVNQQLLQAIDNAIAMWTAIGGGEADAAIAKLQTAKLEAQNLGDQAQQNYLQWDRVGDLFVNGLSNAFDSFAQAVAEGQSVGEAARNAFLQFAADFLREIAQMIIKQAILNALRAAFGGTPFGSLIGIGAAHTGGLIGSKRAGSGNRTRQVSPGVFASAQRYHTGGLVGLAPNEVPIIAKKGEEMLTEDDPRHMLNGGGKGESGGGGGQAKGQTIVNAFDSPSFLESALASAGGQEVLMNFVKANKDSFVSLLEG